MTKEIRFRSAGAECAADLYRPKGLRGSERRPALVLGHGFSLVKSTLAEQAQALADAGFVVLAIDYRTFGDLPDHLHRRARRGASGVDGGRTVRGCT